MSLLRRLMLLVLLASVGLDARAQTSPDPYATQITIEKSGRIKLRLDGRTRTVRSADLTDILTKAGNPGGRTVYIKAAPLVTFATVQDTLDRVRQAGITEVEVISPYKKH